MATATVETTAHAFDALLAHDLLYVTGKGGAGKTTVAAALSEHRDRERDHGLWCGWRRVRSAHGRSRDRCGKSRSCGALD
jgi:hypothetical protein